MDIIRGAILFTGVLAWTGAANAAPLQAMFGPPPRVLSGATVDCDFSRDLCSQKGLGVGPSAAFVTNTRASPETCVDINGYWHTVGNNQTCLGRGAGINPWESRGNSIRNSAMSGAVSGSVPPLWIGTNAAANLSWTLLGPCVESGINCYDFQLSGTANSGASSFFVIDNTAAAVSGQTFAQTAFFRATSGSFAGFSSAQFQLEGHGAGDAFLESSAVSVTGVTNASLTSQRLSISRTLTSSGTTHIDTTVVFTPVSGQTVLITLRVGWPLLEANASFAGPPILTFNGVATRSADNGKFTTVPAIGSTFSTFAAGTPEAPASYTTNQIMLSVSDGTNGNRASFLRLASTGQSQAATVGTAGTVANFAFNGTLNTQPILAQNALVKAAAAMTGASSMTAAIIGARSDGQLLWNGTISRVALESSTFPRLQLQQITSGP